MEVLERRTKLQFKCISSIDFDFFVGDDISINHCYFIGTNLNGLTILFYRFTLIRVGFKYNRFSSTVWGGFVGTIITQVKRKDVFR